MGQKNIKNHWNVCAANPIAPINLAKGKQLELVFDPLHEGEGRLKGWTFNSKEVRVALVFMIIIDELPFRFVEKLGFKHFMSIACPKFQIPHRTTIARDCLQLYNSEKEKLSDLLRCTTQRVCCTTDTWTSIQRINYMCLTLHLLIMIGICKRESLLFVLFLVIREMKWLKYLMIA